jgi:hypothetical protein
VKSGVIFKAGDDATAAKRTPPAMESSSPAAGEIKERRHFALYARLRGYAVARLRGCAVARLRKFFQNFHVDSGTI